MDAALVIFVRFPQPGKVKSRLGRDLGPGQAAAFYRLCTEKIIREMAAVLGVEKFLSYSDEKDENNIQKWLGARFTPIPQAEGDIGERLETTFRRLFTSGFSRVVIIASDVPDLTKQILASAVGALENHDLVIGPGADGGYYLIGMKQPHGELFKGIPWSTDEVLERTLRVAGESGLSVFQTAVLRDIDTLADLKAWEQESAGRINPLLEYTRGVLDSGDK